MLDKITETKEKITNKVYFIGLQQRVYVIITNPFFYNHLPQWKIFNNKT